MTKKTKKQGVNASLQVDNKVINNQAMEAFLHIQTNIILVNQEH